MKTLTAKEFINLIPRKNTKSHDKFYKKLSKEGGIFSYQLNSYINWEEFEKLSTLKDIEGYESIFHYFINSNTPFNMKVVELKVVNQKVDSNNVYAIMAAPQRTFYKASFQIKFNQEIVEVEWEYDKDTTLSYREINSFM